MATVNFLGISYPCARALMGNDYIHLLDERGVMVTAFDGVVDFSKFTIVDGEWETPMAEGDCYLAVIKEDGSIGKGTHKCCDISKPTLLASGSAAPNGTLQIIDGQSWGDWRFVEVGTSLGTVFMKPTANGGVGSGFHVAANGTVTSVQLRFSVSGQTVTVVVASRMEHQPSGSHGAANNVTVNSITGLIKAGEAGE